MIILELLQHSPYYLDEVRMDYSKSTILARLASFDTLKVIVGLYIAQVIAVKAYWLFVYPYYVSPLRHLPGPKVRTDCTCNGPNLKSLTACLLGPPLPHRPGDQPVQEREP